MKTSWLAPFLLLAAGSVQAAETKPAAKPQASGDAKSKLVCFAEATTGSHLKKRVCMTEEERERRKQMSQDAATKQNRSASGTESRKWGTGK